MATNLSCMCGKTLTDYNVCPIPSGVQCNGQFFSPEDARARRMLVLIGEQLKDSIFTAGIYVWGYYG